MRLCFGLLAGLLVAAPALGDEKGDKKVPGVLNFKMKGLDGKDVNLADYQGKVVLFVNVASKCGYTGQYKGLEALHEKYADKGLVIIGVPANDFGEQEPGSDAEIANFCKQTYGVKFLMLSKVPTIVGAKKVPLYKYLTEKESDPKFAGEVDWNFTKFLVNRKGEIVGRFEPKVEPKEIGKTVEAELAK
jgi:glutathione peroxidase